MTKPTATRRANDDRTVIDVEMLNTAGAAERYCVIFLADQIAVNVEKENKKGAKSWSLLNPKKHQAQCARVIAVAKSAL